MTKVNIKKVSVFVTLLIGVFGIAGCGGGGSSSSSPSDTPQPEQPKEVVWEYPDEIVGNAESARGVAIINDIRWSVGLPLLKTNIKLERAGDSHSNYTVDVHNEYDGVLNHNEDNDRYPSEYFTGETPLIRAIEKGYNSDSYVGEAMTYFSSNIDVSVDELMSAIYHRFGLLFNFVEEIGVGISTVKLESASLSYHTYSYELASHTDRMRKIMEKSPLIVLYPPEGSKNIRRVFYEETPDPLPSTGKSGYPISIEFNSALVSSVDLIYFKLYDESGSEITDTTVIDKDTDVNHRLTAYQFVLFPMQVLEPLHTYRVEINYVADGENVVKTWSFTTREVLDPMPAII